MTGPPAMTHNEPMDATGTGAGLSELIGRCLRGEQSACQQLYRAHAGRVRVYFRRSGFAPADADDLTQEAFIRVFRSLGGFDAGRGAFSTWVGAIARNVARKRWARRADPSDLDPELAEEMLAATDNPAADSEQREQLDALARCVGELPEEPARLVRLRYVQGLTTRGLAAATGLPEATVRLRLAQAVEALTRCMKAKGMMGQQGGAQGGAGEI